MDQEELFRRLAVALAIGLLVGLERGWQTREDSDHQRAAGLRTFALTGLLGGICGLLSLTSGPIILGAGLLALTAAIGSFSYLEAKSESNFSATGVVAAILTFVLGAYATLGNEVVAVAAAVAMAILLALRESLHSWVRKLTWLEIRSVLMLLAMTFLLLPILPNRPVDPWNVLNPAEIWLLAILIAAISFAGYVAVRVFGETKGVAVAAVAGGLASSTATTLSFARMAREHPESTRLLAGGILLAGATMLARLITLAVVLKPALLLTLLGPAVAAGAVLLAGSGFLLRNSSGEGGEAPTLTLRNPFDLGTALKLAGLIALIMVAAKALADQASSAGIYLLAAVSGLADVDALTLSMARFAGSQVSLESAGYAILVAAGVNTISKAVMAAGVGGARLGKIVGGLSAAALAALVVVALLSAK
ncbi:MgtC/SapB family protein [Hyphomicrobium sp. CS1GBMeth3]|uniref:MgtC/SapB family protein n=1 Tax=Hyphomicrobium sp. CS1GBMeth3 TaxID=1892845 RepID=UPI00093071C2|nr:MgtC/SapB family protein [Hyphomicrobium sp. CS1GBMeth3]